MDPTPVCIDHDDDFNWDDPDYTWEEIEVTDDVPKRTKRSADDDESEEAVIVKRDVSGYDDQLNTNDLEDWVDEDDSQGDHTLVAYSYRHQFNPDSRSDFERFHDSDRDDNNEHAQTPRRRRIRTSLVRMPTSHKRDVSITIPNMRGWKCGLDKTRLINLDPNGKMGKREYKIVVDEMEKTRMTHPSGVFRSYNVLKIEKAVNGCFWKRYKKRQEVIDSEAGYRNERMLFHGSSKVKELLEFGFDERYANSNGMFGAGIYLAKHSSKANQYAFGMMQPCPTHKDLNCDICERQMMLVRATLGKMKEETAANKRAHAPPGHHSVYGKASPGGLKYAEYIVYRGEQLYAEYVITYKIVK